MSAPPPVHDALTILRHSFALPMLHVLRTSPAFLSSLLPAWDNLLLSIFSNITNIDIHPGDPAWLQATLPVGSRGLGIRSACHLAPSAFLASADGASSLMLELLPVDLSTTPTWKGSLPWLPGDMSCHRTLLYLPLRAFKKLGTHPGSTACLMPFFQHVVTKNLELGYQLLVLRNLVLD